MITLQKDAIPNIKGIVYFKSNGKIYAILNTYSNLFSYMQDLSKDNQDFFKDLSEDTKDEDNVFIYDVSEELKPFVDDFLTKNFTQTDHYDYLDEYDDEANKLD